MKPNQQNKGSNRRLMCLENKDGTIEGDRARIGWVSFSKSGQSIYYKDRVLMKVKGGGIRGNFLDSSTGEEYWVSGVKKSGSNTHPGEPSVTVVIDDDAKEEYQRIRSA